MSDVAIRTEGLSKGYRIGQGRAPYRTLREAISRAALAPLRFLKRRTAAPVPEQDAARWIWALKDASFEIKQGEVVGVIGRNGAGKSTLLKLLSRITDPTEGRAEVHGRIRALLEVGTGFHPELTGRENVFLNGALLGMKKGEIIHRFDDIVAFSEIERFIDTPVKFYSSGMYVRLAFAVAAHLQPEILLVDEVLSVGDDAFQKKCLGKMDAVAREGRTVLYVSHSMASIDRLCSRAILLEEGRIAMDGPAHQVIEKYLAGGSISMSQWERPDSMPLSQELSILKVTARDENGLPASTFRGDQPIVIEIVYRVHRSLTACQLGFWVTNAKDIPVFATADTDELNTSAIAREPGTYRTTITTPPHFLASGQYRISLGAHMPWRASYDEVLESIRIEVLTVGSFECFDSRKTVVVPLFHWQTRKEE